MNLPATGHVVQSGRLTFDPERHDEALEALEGLAVESRKEEGSVAYVWASDFNQRGTFHLFEEWATQDALDRHASSSHGRELLARLPGLGLREATLRHYVVAEVNDLALPN